MPSMRHLLENIGRNDNLDYLDIYALLKALVEAVEERDQATGERENLLESCRWWKQCCMNAKHQLAEAKAEIEKLRGKCEWEELCKGYPGLCAEAEVVVKSIKADAEIGRLVRGMRPNSGLRYVGGRYHALAYVYPAWGGLTAADTPAEALRAIQTLGEETPAAENDAVYRKLLKERDDLVCQIKERLKELGHGL